MKPTTFSEDFGKEDNLAQSDIVSVLLQYMKIGFPRQ